MTKYNYTAFLSVLSLLPTEVEKLNALMLRDNHGETVFYRLCINNKELAFVLLQGFTLENQQKLLTQRSLRTYEFVDDPNIIGNQHHWDSHQQFPLWCFIPAPEHLPFLLNCFSEEAFCEFLNIYSFQRTNLLEYSVAYPKSLELMLQKLGPVSCRQQFKNNKWSVLRFVADVAVFDVLDSIFSQQEIRALLLQGSGPDHPNEHPLFRQMNIISHSLQTGMYPEKTEESKRLLHRMLSYFEHDEERIELISKQSFYGYTLLYHPAVLGDIPLCKILLEWTPRQHLLQILIDEVTFHQFLDRQIDNHQYEAVVEPVSLGLVLASNPESLSFVFSLLSTEDRFAFLRYLLMTPNLVSSNEAQRACLVILKEQVIALCGLTDVSHRNAITKTFLGWIPSSIGGTQLRKQHSDYQAIINTTTIDSLQHECAERLMFENQSAVYSTISR